MKWIVNIVIVVVLCFSVGCAANKCPEWLSDLTTAAEYWVANDCANPSTGNNTITSCMSSPCQAKCAQALLKWSDADYRSCTNLDPSLNGTMWANALKQCRCKGSSSAPIAASMAVLALTTGGLVSLLF